MVRSGAGLLQGGVGGDHFAGDQVPADVEMLKRTLSFSAPQFVRGHFNRTEAVGLFSHGEHVITPMFNLQFADGWTSLQSAKRLAPRRPFRSSRPSPCRK